MIEFNNFAGCLSEAKKILDKQALKAHISSRYVDDFGLCFIITFDQFKMLIKSSVFFTLAEENRLSFASIKRNSLYDNQQDI